MDDQPRISGAPLLDQFHVAKELYGPEAFAEAMGRLSPEDQETLGTMQTVTWVQLETAHAYYDALGEVLGRDPQEVHVEVVQVGIERTFKTLWRMLLRLTTDEALVRRTPLIYSRAFDKGELVSRIEEPGRAELLLRGWSSPGDRDLNGLAAGIEKVLSIAGRRGSRVRWERRPGDVRFEATWRP